MIRGAAEPLLVSGAFKIVEEEVADSFDNASVILEGDGLRIRFVRERGQISADLAASHRPGQWFDSRLLQQLETSFEPELSIVDPDEFVEWISERLDWLKVKFASSNYESTASQLRSFAEESARRRFRI